MGPLCLWKCLKMWRSSIYIWDILAKYGIGWCSHNAQYLNFVLAINFDIIFNFLFVFMQHHSFIGTNLLNINLEIQSHIWYHHHIITIIINITRLVLWFRCLRQLRRSLQEYFLKTKKHRSQKSGLAAALHISNMIWQGGSISEILPHKSFLSVVCLSSIGFSDGYWIPCLLVVGCFHISLLFEARWTR